MPRFMSSRLRSFAAAVVMLSASSYASAQVFPAFQGAIYQPAESIDQGISTAQVPNGLYGSVLMGVYASSTAFAWTISADGQNFNYSSVEPYSTVPNINCNAATPSTCSATIATLGNVIYIAFSDANTHGLDIVTATVAGGSNGYSFNLISQDNSVQLVTAPSMSLAPDGQHLIVMYGTSTDSNTKNQFYESVISSSGTVSGASEGGNLNTLRVSSAAKPSMAILNGTLWLCSQQNNSNHQLFIYSSTDGINWTFQEDFSGLALGGGASMVNFRGNLVLANQQNNNQHNLFIFSSPNGTSWYAQEYTGTVIGGDPALSLFNNEIALTFRGNNSKALYGTVATQ